VLAVEAAVAPEEARSCQAKAVTAVPES